MIETMMMYRGPRVLIAQESWLLLPRCDLIFSLIGTIYDTLRLSVDRSVSVQLDGSQILNV